MKGNKMEIIVAICGIVLTISMSVALISVAKKNFAITKAMGAVDTIADWYEIIFAKTVELFDKTMNGEIY